MVQGKALVNRVVDDKVQLKVEDISIDELDDNHALVKVESVAQNPTDFAAYSSNIFGAGAVLGCDFTGTVEDTGSKVTRVKKGDRIAGLIWGGELKGRGAYSQYTVADEKICFKVPKNLNSDDAATVPLAAGTAWLALYSKTCLNISRTQSNHSPVLVWGGSSSVGQYTIQLAHEYKIPIIAVCSPKHFEHCRSLGAKQCFDYKSDDVVAEIRAAAPDIAHVFDCIGKGDSSTLASRCVRDEGGVLCTVRPGKALTEDVEERVKVTDVLVWTAFLKDHHYGKFSWPASQEDHDLASELYDRIPGWLEDGTLKTNKSHVLSGGLEAVNKGFEMHKEGKISGFKLVYHPWE